MKSVLLIGLGRFGRGVAEKLNELHHQVLAVDKNEERVNEILPLVTDAQIGDATSETFLRTLGVDNFVVCIVTIGEDFQSSLETTSLLKELGAKKVVSRASREVHRKFLLRNGADDVINPENRSRNGPPSDMPPTMFWIISSWMTTMPYSKYPFPRNGQGKRLDSSIYAKNTG